MDPDLQARGKLKMLLEKGVSMPNPASVTIGEEVDVDRISGDGVTIFPGCRIFGRETVISSGVTLGEEAPVTIDNCRLGKDVQLKGGYCRDSVFLEGAAMGSGAQVREGCLLEEGASGAHCVGLKQTILFPFVTLGSLINFCDCFMSGGSSRDDHSEVGSSWIHFNFTPDGDKTTPSLFGEVPRGVMLDRPRIFLGGQGGAVGPVRVAYGTVVAAGSILRGDVLKEGQLVVVGAPPDIMRRYPRHAYFDLAGVVSKNVHYLAQLVALEHWYREVRIPCARRRTHADGLVCEGALDVLAAAKKERSRRLLAMAERVPAGDELGDQLRRKGEELVSVFLDAAHDSPRMGAPDARDRLLTAVEHARSEGGPDIDHVGTIRRLTAEQRQQGSAWLQSIVDELRSQAGALLENTGLLAPE